MTTPLTRLARAIYALSGRGVLNDRSIRHFQPSVIYSKEDANPSRHLIDLCSEAIRAAFDTHLECGKANLQDSLYLNVFPGEHYRLLNAISRVSKARNIVEIGTYTGMGTLSLCAGLDDVQVTTYDVVAWDQLDAPSHFDRQDMETGKITQVLADLSDDIAFAENAPILNDADLIFMDAPKDDVFEYNMARQLQKLDRKPGKILLLDDIQFVNMIDFWRSIRSPKLDITAFGHWSGTGIVDISNGFDFEDLR